MTPKVGHELDHCLETMVLCHPHVPYQQTASGHLRYQFIKPGVKAIRMAFKMIPSSRGI